jgi:hypothetical protein
MRSSMALFYLTVILGSCLSLSAQETTAGVQGTIKDSTDRAIPNATVEITGAIGSRKVETDSAGAYRFAELPPGEYTLTVSATGFSTAKQPAVRLNVGRLPSVDFMLKVGEVTQTVEVTDAVALVDVTQSKVAVDVERAVIDNIPKGRSFQSLITFAPGARMEPLQGGRNDKNNSFQVDGASDAENVYLVDGVNMTDAQGGGVGKSFQMDFVETVQIKSGGMDAQYGGALGGVINAVPRRGSNDWHGSLMSYFQMNNLNATDPCLSGMTAGYNGPNFSGPTAANVNVFAQGQVCGLRLNPRLAPLSTAQRLDGTPEYYIPKKDGRNIIEPGYEIGGPLVSDKLWLFSSYIPTIADPGQLLRAAQHVQSLGLQRHEYAAPVRGLELFLWKADRSACPPGQCGRPAQYPSLYRPEYAPFGCRIRLPDLRVQFRRRLDSDLETGGQRSVRIFLQQRGTARSPVRGSRRIPGDRECQQ